MPELVAHVPDRLLQGSGSAEENRPVSTEGPHPLVHAPTGIPFFHSRVLLPNDALLVCVGAPGWRRWALTSPENGWGIEEVFEGNVPPAMAEDLAEFWASVIEGLRGAVRDCREGGDDA